MPDRSKFIATLQSMPDEAFSWLILACQPPGFQGVPHVWPDGTGGFMPASRESIAAAQAAAAAYLDEAEKS